MVVEYAGHREVAACFFRMPPGMTIPWFDDLAKRTIPWFPDGSAADHASPAFALRDGPTLIGVVLNDPDGPIVMDDRVVFPDGVWYFSVSPERVVYSGARPLSEAVLRQAVTAFIPAHMEAARVP